MTHHFFIAEDPINSPGAVFIIGARFPFFVGQVYRFKTENELKEWKGANKFRPITDIAGYHAVIAYHTVLFNEDGSTRLTYEYLEDMARFFSKARIEKDQGYWKKFAATKAL